MTWETDHHVKCPNVHTLSYLKHKRHIDRHWQKQYVKLMLETSKVKGVIDLYLSNLYKYAKASTRTGSKNYLI